MSVCCYWIMLILSVFLLFGGCLAQQDDLLNTELNLTLDSNLQSMKNLTAVFTGSVKIYCQLGQDYNYHVYNVNEDTFDGCQEPGDNVIGSCYNSPLVINIRKLSMNFQGLVSYEIGKTYYFAAYITEYNPSIDHNTEPCHKGMKFSFTVVSNEPETSSVITLAPTSSLSMTPSPSFVVDSSSLSPSSLSVLVQSTTTESSMSSTVATVTRPVRPSYTTSTTHARPTNAPDDNDDDDDDLADLINPLREEGIADHGTSVTSSLPFLLMCSTIVLLLLHRLL